MKIAVTGGTGFIGRHLVKSLIKDNNELLVFSRNPQSALTIFDNKVNVCEWASNTVEIAKKIEGYDAIINLAGENIGNGRWNNEKKKKILKSRTDAGQLLVKSIQGTANRPKILIQGSAIGYYGDSGQLTDESSQKGKGFLADVASATEDSVKKVELLGIKLAIVRTAPVLGEHGGFLEQILKPFRFYMGGIIGSGKEWFSWIHINDEIEAIKFILSNQLSGIFNLSSPNPVQTEILYSLISKFLHKPCFFKFPKVLFKLLMGEKADEIIFSNKRSVPKKLIEHGFKFEYEMLEQALKNII